MLYTLTINDHASAAVHAFVTSDGTSRWQTPVAGCMGYPTVAPLVADGVVYVALSGHPSNNFSCHGPTGWVYALDASDGRVLWRVPFERVVWSTLALTNGVIVVANSTYPASPEIVTLTGLRASDGKRLWRISRSEVLGNDLDQFTATEGIVITSQNAPSGMDVEAYRASDGVHLWETKVSARLGEAPPFLMDAVVYIYSDLGYLYALHASDGAVIWRFQTNGVSIGAPILANGHLYLGIGPALDVLDVTSGALMRSYLLFDPSAASSDARYVWSVPTVTESAIFVSAASTIARPVRCVLLRVWMVNFTRSKKRLANFSGNTRHHTGTR